MSLGATLSGINVHIAIEKDKNAASTYGLNHPHTTLIVSDVESLSTNSIRAFRRSDTKNSIVFGGTLPRILVLQPQTPEKNKLSKLAI